MKKRYYNLFKQTKDHIINYLSVQICIFLFSNTYKPGCLTKGKVNLSIILHSKCLNLEYCLIYFCNLFNVCL